MPLKSDNFPQKCALLEAIARCIRDDARIDCACNLADAQYQGFYISVVARGYGGGRPKNLLSLYLEQPLICAYIPRIKQLDEFEQRYGFRAFEIRPDNTSSSTGKPYHTVSISTKLFDSLTSGGDTTIIRSFLIRSTRDSLAMRGLSEAGLGELQETASRVNVPSVPASPTPPAPDLTEGSAGRVKTTTYRILRDTAKALRVKALHDYRCQICGHRIKLPNRTYYAEAHHIQPLGEDGPDSERNIICVCPNHHAELDYRATPLDLSKLRTVSGHSIDPKFVDYHNRVKSNQR